MLANSEDPDQTPRSAASDLSLRCLPMSQKWDARLIYIRVGLSFGLNPAKLIFDQYKMRAHLITFLSQQ